MTDTNVRNVLFDPRCGWVLISNGVYLGTSKVTGRARALQALSQRETYFGLREATTGMDAFTPGRVEARERLREKWRMTERMDKAHDRMRRERKG